MDGVVPEGSRGRGARGRVVVAAAGAVLATIVGVTVLGPGSERPEAGAGAAGTTSPSGSWRTEHWHDVSVEVPADWWYGGGLMPGDTTGPYACFPEPSVIPEGERSDDRAEATGYVGRPIALTDVCIGDLDAGPLAGPAWPYLWFGAPLDVGTEDLGDGWVRETIEVNGSRITVASDNDALRERILGSARGGETCMSAVEPAADADVFPRIEGGDAAEADALTVCAYRVREPAGRFPVADLTYAATLGDAAVHRYLVALQDGERPRDQCPALDAPEHEWVVLELEDGDGDVLRRDVVHLVCAGVDVGSDSLRGFETVELTPDMVRPWAVGGIPAVVYGPTGGKGAMLDSFIGPLG